MVTVAMAKFHKNFTRALPPLRQDSLRHSGNASVLQRERQKMQATRHAAMQPVTISALYEAWRKLRRAQGPFDERMAIPNSHSRNTPSCSRPIMGVLGHLRDIEGLPFPLESISTSALAGFHRGNTGSNPVGDANNSSCPSSEDLAFASNKTQYALSDLIANSPDLFCR